MSLQPTQREKIATRQAKSKPANYKWIPPEWENMTEAQRDADFWDMVKHPCAFIWDWASANPRVCYQCGESEASHLD